jgi:hypothetical protein
VANNFVDFDGDGLKLVQDFWQLSKDAQYVRNTQYMRDYKLYSNYTDIADRDPDRPNVFIPKTYSNVEIKTSRDIKLLFGQRPYIPFEARRKEFRLVSQTQTELLDEYLDKGGFFDKAVMATKLKNLYGTSFTEIIPYFELVTQKQIVPEMVFGRPTGSVQMIEAQVPRLTFRITTFGPWEVYVDPVATSIEEKGGCRGLIKLQIVSRREIIKLAQAGGYPNLDVEILLKNTGQISNVQDGNWGQQMLSELGLTRVLEDSDLGLLMRYESEERYIDVWNGTILLRDIPNPFNHKLINLSRFPHSYDAHSQNKFWGIGESKPMEVLQHMINDLVNMTLRNHEMINEGIIYYRNDAVDPNALVRTAGNRVGVDSSNDKPISDSIFESPGTSLPRDHYMLPEMVERWMDVGSGVFDIQRGETAQKETTATESALRKESGDARHEVNIKMGEQIYLKDIGKKCLSHIDQFATTDDMVEVVGIQQAMNLITASPADLPGGYNFTFKGSDRVSSTLIKQRNWREVAPVLLSIPNILPGKLAEKLLQVFELNDFETSEMILPDELVMMLQMAAGQAEAQKGTDGKTTQKSRTNNTQQTAISSGAASR